jgi:hypothetical protein
MHPRSSLATMAALAAATCLTGCAGGAESGSPAAGVHASVSLARSGVVSSAALSRMVLDLTGGRVPLASVDSLIVTVTRVDVLPDSVLAACRPPTGDSTRGFHPGPPTGMPGGPGMNGPRGPGACEAWQAGHGMMGPPPGAGGPPDSVMPFPRPDDPRTHGDSLLPPDSGWGSRLNQWYSLAVVGGGRLDLMRLPTDTTHGLLLASDTIPAGAYGAARLVISDATLWLNAAFTASDSVTLLPNTPYAVELPHRGGGAMGIMTNAGFTVPTGGWNVVLIFDASQMFASPVVIIAGRAGQGGS